MNTVTKTTKDGRPVVITGHIEHGVAWARATLDGTEIGDGYPGKTAPIDGHPEMTHRLGRLALTTAEFDAVKALLVATQAEYDATVEGAHVKLIKDREWLVNLVDAATGTAIDTKADAFDAGRLAEYFQTAHGDVETAIAQARARLAVFDRKHPEILAELKAEIDRQVNDSMRR